MTEQITLQTPSEILAQQIIARLVHDGLAPEDFSEEIKQIILSPLPTPEDWQLLVEKIIESEARGD